MIDYRTIDLPTLAARLAQTYPTQAETLETMRGVLADLLEYLQAPETAAEETPRRVRKER